MSLFLHIVRNEQADDPFWIAAARATEAMGFRTAVMAPHREWPLVGEEVAGVIIWNAAKAVYAFLAQRFRAAGVPLLVAERGFFDRTNYTQLDPAGFNATASWANELTLPFPQAGVARFQEAWGHQPVRMKPREGYVLALLQTLGDSQLAGASVESPDDLMQALVTAVPKGTHILARPHPSYEALTGHPWVPRADWGVEVSVGRDLMTDAAGAKFAVTINSNSANECLALGVPVIVMGPHLATSGCVALEANPRSLPALCRAYLGGLQSKARDVKNYLWHLATRQYSQVDMADGKTLASLLEAAGVRLP